jgi:hypothetical protein
MNAFVSRLAVRWFAVGTVAVALVFGFGNKGAMASAMARQSRVQQGGGQIDRDQDRKDFKQGYREGFKEGYADARAGKDKKMVDVGVDNAYQEGYAKGYNAGWEKGKRKSGSGQN